MTPRQCEVAAEFYTASVLVQAGYDILVQYGVRQSLYDLVAVKGKRFLPVSVKGSQNGRWMLSVRTRQKATSHHGAIDHWLAAQRDDAIFVFVQFIGALLGTAPHVYVARPIELAVHLKTWSHGLGHGSFQEGLHRRHRNPQYVDTVPSEWLFSQERIDAI